METIQQWIGYLLKLNDVLLGLPALPLIIVLGLALGYGIKRLPWPDNKFIPVIVLTVCPIAYALLGGAEMPHEFGAALSTVTRNLVIGFIGGVLAWLAHNKWLKKYEDEG